jgi:endonuclease/exonuclease/phosphatase (EEP) superfamily protein YafD
MPNGDRIDYVFFKGSKMMKPMNASLHLHPPPLKPFDLPAVEWPSDHFGLIVDFLLLKGN